VGKQHTIEINGQRYDALTGQKVSKTNGTFIDGVRRVPAVSRTQPNHVKAAKTQKSQTLMRRAVKKPSPKAVAPAAAKPSLQHFSTPVKRIEHAKSITKSHLIQKFHTSSDNNTVPAVAQAATPRSRSATAGVSAAISAINAPAQPIMQALSQARSHEQAKPRRVKRHERLARRLHVSPRLVSSGALALAIVVLGGFIAFQNMPNINMRLASSRSGVRAGLPGYHPAGFVIHGGIAYSPGQVAVTYRSSSDARKFTLF
jgi:hypothetical protein